MSYQQPNVAVRSNTKPIYIIVAEDLEEANKIAYYKSQDINECNTFIDFRGFQLTKAQAAQVTKEPHAAPSAKKELKYINYKIPWQRVIRIENITFNKTPQGEKNE